MLLCLDGALADEEGDREEEDGRGEAETDDEPDGALQCVLSGPVVAALLSLAARSRWNKAKTIPVQIPEDIWFCVLSFCPRDWFFPAPLLLH